VKVELAPEVSASDEVTILGHADADPP
jgi:hypothetical protein